MWRGKHHTFTSYSFITPRTNNFPKSWSHNILLININTAYKFRCSLPAIKKKVCNIMFFRHISHISGWALVTMNHQEWGVQKLWFTTILNIHVHMSGCLMHEIIAMGCQLCCEIRLCRFKTHLCFKHFFVTS